MTIRVMAAALVCAFAAFGQGPSVSISEKPADIAVESRYFRDGSNNIEYICSATSVNVPSLWTRSAATSNQPRTPTGVGIGTLTSIVVASNVGTVTTSVAHGLAPGQWITVVGGTVDTDINSAYKIATVGSTTTFTITTASVPDATYNEATLQVYTTAPRLNALVWSIRRLYYTTSYIDRDMPAQGNNSMDKSCDVRTTYF